MEFGGVWWGLAGLTRLVGAWRSSVEMGYLTLFLIRLVGVVIFALVEGRRGDGGLEMVDGWGVEGFCGDLELQAKCELCSGKGDVDFGIVVYSDGMLIHR